MTGQTPPGMTCGRSSSDDLRTALTTRRRGRSDDEMVLVRRIVVCSFHCLSFVLLSTHLVFAGKIWYDRANRCSRRCRDSRAFDPDTPLDLEEYQVHAEMCLSPLPLRAYLVAGL